TPRAIAALAASGVRLDVLVRSASDPGERYEPGMLDPAPRFVVSTRGALGGTWTGETSGSWEATALPGPAVDAYGCGDSFAAALAFGLGAGMAIGEAIELGARCGAACLTGRGPYAGQLELE
ncbi:MAG: PfkB family carbohydrate kinase, partial [Solirubrobacteraceae bacterium]|nr:PfkB family carbohydrate kinase [Solirubrobacteraceae bacterium]